MEALALGGLTETGLLLALFGHRDASAECLITGVETDMMTATEQGRTRFKRPD
jgi:hypothetical protein